MPQPFDETPQLPPDVSGQTGAGAEKVPFSGVGAMMAKQAPAAPTGGASPTGALQSAAEAIEKVLDNMAKMSKVFAPFANRMKQFMQAGLAEATKAGESGGKGQPQGGPPEVSARPPGPGASFPG